jgi:hypothetical protein
MKTGFFVIIIASLSLFCLASNTKAKYSLSEVVDLCYSYLESHLCEGTKWDLPYHFYRPSLDKYSPDQWLWDSGSHMITWSHRNVTNSILDLRTMLQFQQENGRIPEQIYWGDRTPEENAAILKQYSNTQFNDITQMPVLPYSLRSMYNVTKDTAIIKEFLYPLVDFFQWWRNKRDLGDGLVVVLHNWESGIDASPAYDPAFHVYVTELNETSWGWMYPKFHEVVESYRFIYDWDQDKILARKAKPPVPAEIDTWFVMKDLAVNCVYASGWKILSDLAFEIDDKNTAEYCLNQYHISANAIVKNMYQPTQGHFQSLYIDWDGIEKPSIANTIQNLFPLLLYDLPQEKIDLIVNQLSDPNKFASKYAIPTVSMDDPQFWATYDVNLMWRGPVWGFTNWFILEGLGLHHQYDLQVSRLVD